MSDDAGDAAGDDLLAPSGSAHVFTFYDWPGQAFDVHVYIPAAGAERVLFVHHGVGRTAQRYLSTWQPGADALGAALVVPHFPNHTFASDAYHLGNTTDPATGRHNPPEAWTFAAIERVFDQLRSRYGLTASGYCVYGHSAGAQFVHRFVLHMPRSRCTLAVAANAGWYTLPIARDAWPYGLGGSALEAVLGLDDALRAALSFPLVVLLGDQDTNTTHKHLRRTARAATQGPHRVARGEHFVSIAFEAAEQLGVTCAWRVVKVPGAGHNNTQMMPAARELLARHWAAPALAAGGPLPAHCPADL